MRQARVVSPRKQKLEQLEQVVDLRQIDRRLLRQRLEVRLRLAFGRHAEARSSQPAAAVVGLCCLVVVVNRLRVCREAMQAVA